MGKRLESLIVIGGLAGFGQAVAAPGPLPAPLAAELADMQKSCREVSGVNGSSAAMISRPDLNGDGKPDFLVQEYAYDCPGAAGLFAGSAATGQPAAVYLAGPGGGTLVWRGSADNAAIKKIGGRDVLTFAAICETRRNVPVADYRWCDMKLVPGAKGGRWMAVKLGK